MDLATRQKVFSALRTLGKRQLARSFYMATTTASLDDNTLDQLVEMAAESAEIEDYHDAEATPEVKKLAKKFEAAVEKELEAYLKKAPLTGEGYTDMDPDDQAQELMDDEGAYLVLMTLMGHGVGIWDGSWDHFFADERKEIKPLQAHLEKRLGKWADDTGGGILPQAFEEAAFQTAAPDRYEEEFASASTGGNMKPTLVSPTARKRVIAALIKAGRIDLANKVAAGSNVVAAPLIKRVERLMKKKSHKGIEKGRGGEVLIRMGTKEQDANRVEDYLKDAMGYDEEYIDVDPEMPDIWGTMDPKTNEYVIHVQASAKARTRSKRNPYRAKAKRVTAAGWEDTAMAELAEEQGWDLEDVEWSDERSGFRAEAIMVEGEGEEWIVFKDDGEAEDYAKQVIIQDLEHEPEIFSQDWLMNHVSVSPTDIRIIAGEEADNYVENISYDGEERVLEEANLDSKYEQMQDAYETMEEKIVELDERSEELDQAIVQLMDDVEEADDPKAKKEIQKSIKKMEKEMKKADSDSARYTKGLPKLKKQMEALVEKAKEAVHDDYYENIKTQLERDPMGWYEELTGERAIQSWMSLDYDAAAEDAIRTDGVAHFLASYDGNETDLDSGAVAYRRN